MKLTQIIAGIITVLSFMVIFQLPVFSMDDPGFTINRMVMAERIADREPVAVSDTFSADTEEVFCFLEASQVEHETSVTFIWYFEKKEMARVSLPLTVGKRWRTYSSKKLGGLKGNWQVELQEPSGIVLNTVSFQVR